MKNFLSRIFSASGAVFAGLVLFSGQASAVNISIGVGGEVLPGVYGSVNIDNGRYPALVYAEPVLIARPVRVLEPVYLHVPPKHLKRWDRYCDRYGACERPVYFVRSRDYYDYQPQQYVEPRYVYRQPVVPVNRWGGGVNNHSGHYYGSSQHGRVYYNHHQRAHRGDDDDRRHHRQDWKHKHRDHHDDRRGGYGKHGRGYDD